MSLHQDPNYRAYINKYGEAGREYLPSRYLDPIYRDYAKQHGDAYRDYLPSRYLDPKYRDSNIIDNVIRR